MGHRGSNRNRVAAGVVAAQLFIVAFGAAPAHAQAARPATCSTFNAESEPASTFAPGDRITVRGTGFGPGSVVLVSLQQDTRTIELARSGANDLGAFRASDAEIPDTVVSGKASIRALDARGSATCNITIRGAGKDDPGLNVVYVTWGALLAAFGVFLAVVTYRRWKAERLREVMEGFGTRPLRDDDDEDADAPLRPASAGNGRRTKRARSDRSSVELADDAFEEEWAFREHVPAGWVRGRARASSHTSARSSRSGIRSDDDDAVFDDQTAWRPPRPDDDDDVVEPPRLPDDWDEGRVRSGRQASESIERLRREVRSWKKG